MSLRDINNVFRRLSPLSLLSLKKMIVVKKRLSLKNDCRNLYSFPPPFPPCLIKSFYQFFPKRHHCHCSLRFCRRASRCPPSAKSKNAGQQDAALREKEIIDSSFNERVVVTFLVRNSPLPTVNLISLDCDGKCRAEAAGACKAL